MRLSYRLGAAGLAAGVVGSLLFFATSPALAAAPPANDTFSGETAITVPYSATLDTTAATADADDTSANTDCGAPAVEASVWYSLTPSADGAVVLDSNGSDYSVGFIVVTGTPGNFSVVNCGPFAIAVPVTAGTTYHLLVFDYQGDGGGNGGTLHLSVTTAPPPPTIDVTVNKNAGFDSKTGAAKLSGTVTCTGDVEFSFMQGFVEQRVGRGTVQGYFGQEVQCDGTTRPWSADVFPSSPRTKFAGGKAASFTFAFACGQVFCSDDFEEQTVILSNRK